MSRLLAAVFFNTTSGLFVAVFEERTPGNLGQKRIFSKLILRRLNQNLTTGLNLKTYNNMIQICSLQKGTISTFIIKDRQKREALMWPDELQSFRIAEKTSRNLSSPDLVKVRDRAVAIRKNIKTSAALRRTSRKSHSRSSLKTVESQHISFQFKVHHSSWWESCTTQWTTVRRHSVCILIHLHCPSTETQTCENESCCRKRQQFRHLTDRLW